MVWTSQVAADRRYGFMAAFGGSCLLVGLAFFEYCCQVPANRMGFVGNGGPFTLVQLKVIQECVSLVVFTVIINMMFTGQGLHWNHWLAFLLLIGAVYLVFLK